MIQALIIEDEPIIARNLQMLIQAADSGIEIQQVLSTVQESIQWFNNHPAPDLIFSDVQLADGISFEIFEQISLQCPVIFITAYDQYALRAFQVNGIQYLMKPVSKAEVSTAIQKYYQLTSLGFNMRDNMQAMLRDVKTRDKMVYKTRFLAHYMRSMIPVADSQVSCFRKDQLIYLVTTDGREMMTDYHSLDELEELLDPLVFFRANRQHIIHISQIRDFKQLANGKLTVHLNPATLPEVEISREKAALFKSWIG
jgi:two-component system LytT family response regulator